MSEITNAPRRFPIRTCGLIGCLLLPVWLLLASRDAGDRFSRRADAQDAGSPLAGLSQVNDGRVDAGPALQAWIDSIRSQGGKLTIPAGTYRLTQPLVIDLDQVGPIALAGEGAVRLVMEGPGPALRLVGTHGGTAAPQTVQPNVWERQRMPLIDGIEIVGSHPEACGIELTGMMQPILTRLTVRDALHGIHLTTRNRNVQISDCHIYDNHGAGIFLDGVNLHQINIVGCHVSYNDQGGVVCKGSEVRNLQIGSCDIEGNMGGPDAEPSANVMIDSTGASVAEAAIVGCTIQHAHDAPNSANIRYLGKSTARPFTDELRQGNVTIADNVLSDVQVNVEILQARSVTITGNTVWKGYERNLVVDGCETVVVADNAFDRNPRYHYGDGASAQLGIVFRNSTDCTLAANQIKGTTSSPAAVSFENCSWINVSGCSIFECDEAALHFDECTHCLVTGCMVRDSRGKVDRPVAVRTLNCEDVRFGENLFAGALVDE